MGLPFFDSSTRGYTMRVYNPNKYTYYGGKIEIYPDKYAGYYYCPFDIEKSTGEYWHIPGKEYSFTMTGVSDTGTAHSRGERLGKFTGNSTSAVFVIALSVPDDTPDKCTEYLNDLLAYMGAGIVTEGGNLYNKYFVNDNPAHDGIPVFLYPLDGNGSVLIDYASSKTYTPEYKPSNLSDTKGVYEYAKFIGWSTTFPEYTEYKGTLINDDYNILYGMWDQMTDGKDEPENPNYRVAPEGSVRIVSYTLGPYFNHYVEINNNRYKRYYPVLDAEKYTVSGTYLDFSYKALSTGEEYHGSNKEYPDIDPHTIPHNSMVYFAYSPHGYSINNFYYTSFSPTNTIYCITGPIIPNYDEVPRSDFFGANVQPYVYTSAIIIKEHFEDGIGIFIDPVNNKQEYIRQPIDTRTGDNSLIANDFLNDCYYRDVTWSSTKKLTSGKKISTKSAPSCFLWVYVTREVPELDISGLLPVIIYEMSRHRRGYFNNFYNGRRSFTDGNISVRRLT